MGILFLVHTKKIVLLRIFDLHPHPYRMRLQIKGLSHGLKKCPRTLFYLASLGRPFESRPVNQKSPDTQMGIWTFLVHRKGLEPPTLGTGIRCSIH